MKSESTPQKHNFSKYQIFIIAILAILQFTVILDFMVLSPLGAILLKELNLLPSQFGWVVSAYAFSAGASGFLAAGFADRFDRKKMLLFFYAGFIIGTAMCALAPNFYALLIARTVTGIFGGVLGSIGFAIITDLFELQTRGRVMGFVQTAFAASQVFGIPVGLFLANNLGWHSPFWMIVIFSVVVLVAVLIYMKPIKPAIGAGSRGNPLKHLWTTITKRDHVRGFLATILLATGGFMMMPFGSAFSTNNLGIDIHILPVLFTITGLASIAFGPLIGRLADKVGPFKIFMIGTTLSIVIVAIYTNLGITPFWLVTVLNVILFVGISSRIIASSTMLSAVPLPQDRGAFMSVNSSLQQLAGGIAAYAAGMIVQPTASGRLLHYDTLGIVVMVSMLIAMYFMFKLHRHLTGVAGTTTKMA